MAWLHPACGCPTPFIAKVIAVCDLIFGLIGIFWFVYILEGYDLLMKEPSSIYEAETTTTLLMTTSKPISTGFINGTNWNMSTIVTSSSSTSTSHSPFVTITSGGIMINGKNCNIILSAFYTIVNLVAFVLLLSAANDKNICKLKTWFAIRLSIFTLKCFLYVMYIVVGARLYDHIPHMLFMLIHLYGLWVVYVFIHEIREERRTKRLSSGASNVPYTVENKAV